LVCPEVPLGDTLVHAHCLRCSLSKQFVLAVLIFVLDVVDRTLHRVVRTARASRGRAVGGVQLEEVDGVEDEAGLLLAAPVHVAVGFVASAVAPEVDAVLIFEDASSRGRAQGVCEISGVGTCCGEVAEVDGHHVVVVQWRAFGPPGYLDKRERDQ